MVSKGFPSMRQIFVAYCEAFNFYGIGDFCIVKTGQNEGDYYKFYNGDVMLTEGDSIDIEARFKRIARENGLDLREVDIKTSVKE